MTYQPLLRAERITKSFPGVRALDGVDLDLVAGEVHVLLGENGAGKSTLVKMLAGLFPPDGGQILLDGLPVTISSPRVSRRLGISVIHQELRLVGALGAAANICLGQEATGRFGRLRHAEIERRAAEVLARLDAQVDLSRPVERLSVAQQQVIEIAAALLARCRVLVLDEPTSALADHEVERLGAILDRLRGEGVAILYISHRFEEIYRFGDRATVLRNGRYVGTWPLPATPREELIRGMVGTDITEAFPAREECVGETLLQVDGLTSPGRFRDVSLRVRAGEVVTLAGLMGSGRSEVARAIFGVDRAVRGTIRLGGRSLAPGSVREAIRRGLGLVPEDRKSDGLVLLMSVLQNITLARLSRLSGVGGWILGKRERATVSDLLRRLRVVARSPTQSVSTLSGGNQQKVLLARWVQADTKLFILDEPTRGIDIGAKQEVYRLVNELASKGAGVLMVSSELPEVLGMSDRIVVLREGSIAGELSREQASAERIMELATGAAGATAASRPEGDTTS